MNDAEKALAAMGLNPDDVIEADQRLRGDGRPRRTDPRVCLCGHPIARHTIVNGITLCKPARMECPCKKARPVLEVSDIRKFLRRTFGAGKMHALTLGMLSHLEDGKEVKWLVDLKCDRCGVDDTNVVPVPVTQGGKATDYPTGYDALLCRKCREEI